LPSIEGFHTITLHFSDSFFVPSFLAPHDRPPNNGRGKRPQGNPAVGLVEALKALVRVQEMMQARR
jgi:hypothetical protein